MSTRISVLLACLIITIAVSGSARPCPDRIGHWGYGPSEAVAVPGPIALMGSGPTLMILDLESGAQPAILSELRVPGMIRFAIVEGDIGYLTLDDPDQDRHTFVMVDLSNPESPGLLGGLEIDGPVTAVAVQGNTALVASLAEGLVVVDVSDPAYPVRIAAEEDLRPESIVVRDGFAYVAHNAEVAHQDAFVVVDVSDPTSPSIAARVETGSEGLDVALSDDHVLYLSWGGVSVFDVSNPAEPIRVGFEHVGEGTALDVMGNIATVAVDRYINWRLELVDISDPENPFEVGVYDTNQEITDIAARDGLVLLAVGLGGVELIDAVDPSNPVLAARVPLPAPPVNAVDVAVMGDHAYVADRGTTHDPIGRLRVIAIDGEPNLAEVSNLPLPGRGHSVAIHDDDVVVTYGANQQGDGSGLSVVNVSDPAHPTVRGEIELGGNNSSQVVVANDHAYVAKNNLVIVNLSDPSEPSLVSESLLGYGISDIAVVGDRLWAASGRGLCTIDVSDPADPVMLGCVPAADDAVSVAVADGRAYVAAQYLWGWAPVWLDELLVFDLPDEGDPVRVGLAPLWGTAGRLAAGAGRVFIECWERGLLSFDVTNPSHPILIGKTAGATAPLALPNRVFAASGAFGLDVFGTLPCTAPSPVADFVWHRFYPALGEEVQFTDLSAGPPTEWSWNFGGEGTNPNQSPSHAFMQPGTRDVTLTVSNSNGTHSISKRVKVASIADPGGYSFSVLPAVAQLEGLAGTAWQSDIAIHTRNATDSVVFYFMERGLNNTLAPGKRVELAEGTASFEDAVASIFGKTDTAGAILMAGGPVQYSSRTYTTADGGTFGQFIPAINIRNPRWQETTLIHLTENSDFRTNLGLVNLSEDRLDVTADLHAPDGQLLGSGSYTVDPFGFVQVDRFIKKLADRRIDDAMVKLTPTGPDPNFLAYASVVDNTTGDPSFLLEPTAADTELWIPAVAHIEGHNGTLWRSDLEVCSDPPLDARFEIQLLETGRDNTDPRSETFTIASGQCARYRDVVESVFGIATTGALHIKVEAGIVRANSRTYTQRADGGTYGQFIASSLYPLVQPRTSNLIQLAEASELDRGFRTNLGLVNASPIPSVVRVKVRSSANELLNEFEIELAPLEHRQLNQVLAGLSDDDLKDVAIEVWSPTLDSGLFCYASVVDNVTGDAVFIPCQ